MNDKTRSSFNPKNGCMKISTKKYSLTEKSAETLLALTLLLVIGLIGYQALHWLWSLA
jgi:hypothetical protein